MNQLYHEPCANSMRSALCFFQERKADEASDADDAHHEKCPLEPQRLPDESHGKRTGHLTQFLVGTGIHRLIARA